MSLRPTEAQLGSGDRNERQAALAAQSRADAAARRQEKACQLRAAESAERRQATEALAAGKCPKCGLPLAAFAVQSRKVGNTAKRAVVGGVVLGPAGALIGGATGKKRTVSCVNCGYEISK